VEAELLSYQKMQSSSCGWRMRNKDKILILIPKEIPSLGLTAYFLISFQMTLLTGNGFFGNKSFSYP